MTLSWFVPCRRAVVTATTAYHALIESWCAQLETYEAVLSTWYGLSEDDFEVGLAAIRAWRASFFPEGMEIHALRDGEVTLDTWDAHFEPRLWKGAHRVLLEAASGPSEAGETIFDPLFTTDPPLLLTDAREIANPDAVLLVGDVVEMPLFRFLAHAGRADYASYAFNPTGSYLLGTSLDASGVEDPPLHDNRTAMRFQVLLDCMVGAFYHPTPVIRHSRAVSARVPSAVPAPSKKDESLERLIADVRALYQRLAPGPNNLLTDALRTHQSTQDWPHVDADTAAKLWRDAHADNDGSPPPRAFLWWIRERFLALRELDEMEAEREREAVILQSLHEQVMNGIDRWVSDASDLLSSEDWEKHAHVGRAIGKPSKSTKDDVASPCARLCTHEHARKPVAALVLALREKLAALEAHASGASPEANGGGEGPSIYARGMIYAGVLWPAGWKRYYKGVDAWHYATNGWCRNSDGAIPSALPYGSGLELLPSEQPVTPGSSCSDTALLLTNYVIRNHGEEAATSSWGSESVGKTMRAAALGAHYPIQDAYDYLTPEDVAALAPRVTREEQLAGLGGLLSRVAELQHRTSAKGGFWHPILAQAQSHGAWSGLAKSTREELVEHAGKSSGGWRAPVFFLRHLSIGLKKHDGPQHALLCAMHDAFIEQATDFIRDLDALMTTSAEWRTFKDVGPYIPSENADSLDALRHIPPGGFIGRYEGNHDGARTIGRALHYLQKSLAAKLEKLEKLAEHPEKIKDLVGGRIDMSAHLGEVNVVSLTSHEWCMVRLHPAERLMEEPALPRAGFLTAFHPLSGAPYFDAGCRPEGQLFLFEQKGDLTRRSKDERTVRFFGAVPFWFQKIPDNAFEILLEGSKVCFRNIGRDDSRALKGITRLRDAAAMQSAQAVGPGRPMFVHPTTKPPSSEAAARAARKTAEARMVTNGMDMYASRALPFPTLDESEGAFATWQEAARERKRFGSEAP